MEPVRLSSDTGRAEIYGERIRVNHHSLAGGGWARFWAELASKAARAKL